MNTIWNCALRTWQVGIGDPGVTGWVIVGLYLLVGLICFVAAGRTAFPWYTARREKFFWRALGLVLLALAVNKQLDLQSLLTASARCAAQLQGWYENRRVVQVAFIVAILAFMLLFALLLWTIVRGTLRRNGLALIGLIFVLGFVAVRAVGFHGMDALINMRVQGVRVNWALEITGPVLILLAALINMRRGAVDQ
ncbi:isopropylmalate isomerase [Yoonia sp. SS1-5]|uniref:Isopropylmalate isomerase n=1 Tax=Yoonia rhodophyticola TaxID=3137370 RepID=A0AAN0NLG7_9RHOB